MLLGLINASDIIPGAPQKNPIAIVNAKIYTVSGETISSGTVVFDQGVITAIGSKDQVTIPQNAQIIDAKNKHVYPGLIASCTTLGLIEVNAVRASNDTSEVGSINPNAHAYTAYNTDSGIIPTVRSNGILTAHIAPQGGRFSGTSSVVMLDGWTIEEVVLVKSAGVHVYWPSMTVIEAWWMKKSASEQKKNIKTNIEKIADIIQHVKRYKKSDRTAKKDIRWEALLPVIDKKIPLFIHASEYKQIDAAIEFCRKHDLHMVLIGGADAWKITKQLKENNISVILQKTNSLPRRSDEDYDLAFRLPNLLDKAGVKFCISGGTGRSNSWDARNLPFQAGTAVGYGLSKEKALRAITLSAAEILNIDDKVGSIEIGKDATLIIAKGDILDIQTSVVEHAFIQGRKIDLDNRHKRLWRKYKAKYKENNR